MSRLVFKDPERSRLAVEQAVRDARGRGTGALGALIRRLGHQLRAAGLEDPRETARTLVDLAAAELSPAVGNNLPPPVGGLGPRKPILTSAGILGVGPFGIEECRARPLPRPRRQGRGRSSGQWVASNRISRLPPRCDYRPLRHQRRLPVKPAPIEVRPEGGEAPNHLRRALRQRKARRR